MKHKFWEPGSNLTLAEFGARNRLPCGGHWIIGDGFAFCIRYAAHSYDGMASVEEVANDPERRLQLMENRYAWHTLKSRDAVAAQLGLNPMRNEP